MTYTVDDASGNEETANVLINLVDRVSDRDEATLTITITGVNDSPQLSGTEDDQITDKESFLPFDTVILSDVDADGNEEQIVTVSFDASLGSITQTGFTLLGPGSYQVVGTPAEVSAALQGVVFTPFENLIDYIDPGQYTVVFTLTWDDGYIVEPLVDSNTVVTITPINDAPIVNAMCPIEDQLVQVNSLPKAVYLPPSFEDVDDDVAGGDLTWSVVNNSNPILFNTVYIDQGKQIVVMEFAQDVSGIADITIRATDRHGLFVDDTFRVTVEGPLRLF